MRQLLGRERNAGHPRAACLREIQRQAAPAGTDVEHPLLRVDEQLRGEMALFCQLRVVERLIEALEIGAAVLPVGVEDSE